MTTAILTDTLARAGFIAADAEAGELIAAAHGDDAVLDSMLQRRLTGEPLAWITGTALFCGLAIRIDPGVYVPRWLTEPLARHAVSRLPHDGTAIDLCTGSGAIAATLKAARPDARVVGSDIDDSAVRCALANGVEAYRGDLFDPLPDSLVGATDVVVAVVPYVPTPELALLQRDTFTFESTLAYDGGPDGSTLLRRVVDRSRQFLTPGGALLLELGGEQAEALLDDLARAGFAGATILIDEDGDARGVEATLGG